MLTVKGYSETLFLESGLTKYFIACNFRNKEPITIIFFPKCSKFDIDSRKSKKNQKKVLVYKIIAFESGTTNSHIPEQDTCHWQSTCYETHLRFNISLTEIFVKSSYLRVIEYMMKVLSCIFEKSLGSINMLIVKGFSKTMFFREWSNQVFHSL